MNEAYKKFNEYSEGVCGDGAAILHNGKPLTIEEILEKLRNADRLSVLAIKWCDRSHHDWNEIMRLTRDV